MSVYVVAAGDGRWATLPERDLGSGVNLRNYQHDAGDRAILEPAMRLVLEDSPSPESFRAGIKAMEEAVMARVAASSVVEDELPDWAAEAVVYHRLGLSQWRALSRLELREKFQMAWGRALHDIFVEDGTGGRRGDPQFWTRDNPGFDWLRELP